MPTEFATSSVTGQPAFNEFGLTSLQNMAKDKVVEETAKFGLGTLLQGLGPAYTFYSVLDSLGFFDNSMEATPMTPEEAELYSAVQKVDTAVDLAQKASTGDGDTEGFAPEAYLYDAYEAVSALPDSDLEFFGNTKNQLLDDLETQTAQNMLLGLTPGQAAGSVLNTRIPGVTDIPGMGPLFEGAMDKVAETIDGVLGYIGMGDIRGDAVFGPGGASIKFEPKTTKRTPTQGGVSPQGTSGSPNGSTATATTGSRQGDIILNGGTVGDVLGTEMGGEGGYSAVEILHDTIALTCKSNETYDRATFSCIPQSGPTQAAKIICPTGYENAGDEVDSLADCGEKTSTATTTTKKTTKTCWDGSEIAETDTCPPVICPDGTDLAGQEAPDGNIANCDIAPPPPVICPDGTDLAGQEAPDGNIANCDIAPPPPVICPDGTDLAGQEAPDGNIANCDIAPPPPVICPDGTDLAGQEAPDGNIANCDIAPPPPVICPDGTDLAGQEAPDGNLANCDIAPPPPVICPDGTDLAGQEAPDGNIANCDIAPPPPVICPDGTDLAGQEAPDGNIANCDIAPPPPVICPDGTDLAGQEAPDGNIANCDIAPPPPVICPDGTDLAGQEAPDGNIANCDIAPPPPVICPDGTDLAGQEAPDGNLANCDIAPPPPVICPDGTDLAGQEAPDGNLANCDIAPPPPVICPDGTDLAGQEAPDGNIANCNSTDLCDDPVYAAENPAICGVDPDLCNNIAYALLNPEICNGDGFGGMGMPSSSGRTVSVGPAELVNLSSPYDIGGESIFNPRSGGQQSPYLTAKSGGMIETYDEFDELERYLRG